MRKFFKVQVLLPTLTILVLVGGVFLTVLVSQENQDRRGRAQTVATEPGTYGHGGFADDGYGQSSGVSSASQISSPSAEPTQVQPTQ